MTSIRFARRRPGARFRFTAARSVAIPLALLALAATISGAAEIPSVAPEAVGLSSERLARIDATFGELAADGVVPGTVSLIARDGKIAYFDAEGKLDIDAGTPMTTDAVFRIYSMSKPITSVAVMILYEEGRFFLNDPVSKYLPELGGLEVGVESVDPKTGEKVLTTVPSERDMTIRDLLRHTSGLTYGIFGDTLVDRAYIREGVYVRDETIADTVEKLGRVPLKHQPGTRWEYSLSVDVQGRLVEVVSGKRFDEFLRERIFEPLDMKDTGFHVREGEAGRLASMYSVGEDGKLAPATQRVPRDYTKPPTYLSGGGGMVSTARDYLRFCQMLLNGGELDGARILSPKTVDLMSSDHLGDIPGFAREGYGFGLGFQVRGETGDAAEIGSAGEYAWGGAAGTRFWIDPAENMIGIFMIQILPHTGLTHGERFKGLAYQAIVEARE